VDPLTVLVPLPDRPDAARLLHFAVALAGSGGRVLALSVVAAAEGDAGGALRTARAARRRLRRFVAEIAAADVEVQTRVRVGRHLEQIVREAAEEERTQLVVLDGGPATDATSADLWQAGMRRLAAAPPCDAALVRSGEEATVRSVLLPSRGGPTAELALRLALAIAERYDAPLTLLHVEAPDAHPAEREQESRLFAALPAALASPRVQATTVTAASPREAIAAEARRHDVVVLGAQAVPDPEPRLGEVPDAMLAGHPGSVIVVRPRDPVDLSVFRPPPPPVGVQVDTWFAESSFHCREFADVDELVALKQRQGLTISVALMPPGDPGTLPGMARALAELRERHRLIDEIALIGGEGGGPAPAVVSELRLGWQPAPADAPGEAAWRSLQTLRGDLIVWLGADIRNPHPKLVYGLVGPLLRDPRIRRVIGHYRLPRAADDATFEDGTVQVTEYGVRPLLNLFFPELSGVINPLSREHAVRRASLNGLRLVAGAGFELGLLLDQYERDGLSAIAQVDLEERVGRPESNDRLSRLAYDATQVVIRQVGRRVRGLAAHIHPAIKLIREEGERFLLDVIDADEARTEPVGDIAAGRGGTAEPAAAARPNVRRRR
jgi:nucleotide-binding universal stress UspA family protein